MSSICFVHVKSLPQKVSPEAEKSCLNHLIVCGYQYDTKSGEWSRGRLKFEEWQVIKSIILHLRENFPLIVEKGLFAAEIVERAKHIPQITVTRGFVDRCKRAFGTGRRVAGKAVFALWCEETETEIEDDLDLYMKRKFIVVNKVYDQLARAARWLGRKRIDGAVKRNVFIFGEESLTPILHATRRSNPFPFAGLQESATLPLIRPAG